MFPFLYVLMTRRTVAAYTAVLRYCRDTRPAPQLCPVRLRASVAAEPDAGVPGSPYHRLPLPLRPSMLTANKIPQFKAIAFHLYPLWIGYNTI